MRNLNITGCSRIQEILILHKLSNIELPTGCVEITFHQNIEQGKCDSVWYSGDMVTIRYEGYELIINVYGDVAISLYNKKDNCEVVRVRDKNSDRLFYKKMKIILEMMHIYTVYYTEKMMSMKQIFKP